MEIDRGRQTETKRDERQMGRQTRDKRRRQTRDKRGRQNGQTDGATSIESMHNSNTKKSL